MKTVRDLDAELEALRQERDRLKALLIASGPYASRYADSRQMRTCEHPCGSCNTVGGRTR